MNGRLRTSRFSRNFAGAALVRRWSGGYWRRPELQGPRRCCWRFANPILQPGFSMKKLGLSWKAGEGTTIGIRSKTDFCFAFRCNLVTKLLEDETAMC